MSNKAVTVAVFVSHTLAEDAVRKLAIASVDMKSISIIGKDYHSEENPVEYYNAGDRAKIFRKIRCRLSGFQPPGNSWAARIYGCEYS
ncbi:hypothetical protein CT676_34010 [Bradyrhizobium sp. MOS001]|uniref:hypothetical protein n=1 Tax=Bradyrhizobium sp. MOS001 TaxID=2133948 RepID=UPI0010757C22|nr:hypothetical protein [Bradyrhizobium sp. MOS001]TFW56703.1 hypothetical protein CT676_34010 [Bradyrhizobium sp. MOS001]